MITHPVVPPRHRASTIARSGASRIESMPARRGDRTQRRNRKAKIVGRRTKGIMGRSDRDLGAWRDGQQYRKRESFEPGCRTSSYQPRPSNILRSSAPGTAFRQPASVNERRIPPLPQKHPTRAALE